jgi:hypothetical protein
MIPLFALSTFLRALLLGSTAIALENMALRHQLAVLQRSVRRPRLSRWDRILWVGLSRCWAGWRSSLLIVRPATVLAWHRQGFQLYWRWKSLPGTCPSPKSHPPDLAAIRDPGLAARRRSNSTTALPAWRRCVSQLAAAIMARSNGRGDYAARRTYRWCRPPTSRIGTTFPSCGGSTGRSSGASLVRERWVRVRW